MSPLVQLDASAPVIIGQPVVREVFISAVVNCSCASKHALFLSGIGNVGICPDCQHGSVIVGIGVDRATGRLVPHVVHAHIRDQARG